MSQTTPDETAAPAADAPSAIDSKASAKFSTPPESAAATTSISMTQKQADEIISLLKSIKQNIFILTLVAGFFALRAIVFHR